MARSLDAGTIGPMPAPISHHVTIQNLRLHYTEAGEGDPILLLHGFPTSSHLYRNILPQLAKTHRAIALDLPGYGLSDKPLDVSVQLRLLRRRDRFIPRRPRHRAKPT